MSLINRNKVQTQQVLPFKALVEALRQAALDYHEGRIINPARLVVPIAGGSMVAMSASAPDVAITKLINIVPGNPMRGLETINGQAIIWDVDTGLSLCTLDGPIVTGRRTAALSMLAIELIKPAPQKVAIYGSGHQAVNHIQALSELFPGVHVYILGTMLEKAKAFCEAYQDDLNLKLEAARTVPDDVDVVITTTTSKTPVYLEAARPERLIIAIGSFHADSAEIAAKTVQDSFLFIDDIHSLEHEAGDYLMAKVDSSRVHPLSDLLVGNVDIADKAVMFKSVGCAAWDLAAARVVKSFLDKPSLEL